MNVDTWVQVGAGTATTVAAAWVGRAARRTRRQESRDDFTAVSRQQAAINKQQAEAIGRLENRVRLREEEAEAQRERIAEFDEGVAWLLTRVRDLVTAIRKTGAEPPPARPMSARAARILERSDV